MAIAMVRMMTRRINPQTGNDKCWSKWETDICSVKAK